MTLAGIIGGSFLMGAFLATIVYCLIWVEKKAEHDDEILYLENEIENLERFNDEMYNNYKKALTDCRRETLLEVAETLLDDTCDNKDIIKILKNMTEEIK